MVGNTLFKCQSNVQEGSLDYECTWKQQDFFTVPAQLIVDVSEKLSWLSKISEFNRVMAV